MAKYSLDDLQAALIERNSLLASRLRPPLSEAEVTAALTTAKIAGTTEAVVAIYSWHNGTVFDEPLMKSKTGFFPGQIYQFIDLERAIGHMEAYGECVCSCFPKLADYKERFLPIFWNGATNWIAVDLKSSKSRIVLIRYFVVEASVIGGRYQQEVHETEPPREAYNSFEQFLEDAIRANRENRLLACFRTNDA